MTGNDALAAKATAPHFEHIVTAATESFLWRLDDYPWARNVWNFHPECEIHLIRNASGVALVGDHIGEFGPGYLAVVGSNLPPTGSPRLHRASASRAATSSSSSAPSGCAVSDAICPSSPSSKDS